MALAGHAPCFAQGHELHPGLRRERCAVPWRRAGDAAFLLTLSAAVCTQITPCSCGGQSTMHACRCSQHCAEPICGWTARLMRPPYIFVQECLHMRHGEEAVYLKRRTGAVQTRGQTCMISHLPIMPASISLMQELERVVTRVSRCTRRLCSDGDATRRCHPARLCLRPDIHVFLGEARCGFLGCLFWLHTLSPRAVAAYTIG